MEAKVQYNDLRGSAAADVSDFYHNSLQTYLTDSYKGYDGERYYCEGFTLWAGNQGPKTVNVGFVCRDKIEGKYVKFIPENYTYDQLFNLFKRFNVVMGTDIESVQVSDDDWLDLSE